MNLVVYTEKPDKLQILIFKILEYLQGFNFFNYLLFETIETLLSCVRQTFSTFIRIE